MKSNKLLIVIIILGSFLRLWQISTLPVSLNWDEVSHGYNAYSILKTGSDEWGISMPSIFRGFGDFKLPAYIYATAIWVFLLGPTAAAVRLTSALSGIASILSLYLLIQYLSSFHAQQSPWLKKNARKIGLYATFLFAIEPWNVFLSRVAVEANFGACLFLTGLTGFYLGLNQMKEGKKAWGFMLSGILFGLSLFAYNSFRIVSPLMVTLLSGIYWQQWGIPLPKWFARCTQAPSLTPKDQCPCFLYGAAFFLMFFTVMTYQMLFTSAGQARASNIFVIDQGVINQINEHRGASTFPPVVAKLIHNKATYTIILSSKNYLTLVNPRFWYVDGGTHYQFSIPQTSLLYITNLPLLILSFLALKKMPRQGLFFFLAWILIAPLPASMTRDNPHPLRIITLSPVPQILAGIGLTFFIDKIKKPVIKYLLLVLWISTNFYQLVNWWTIYQTSYNQTYAWVWQDGTKQMVEFIKQQYPQTDRIYITKRLGEPHEFILFYWPWDPQAYQESVRWEYRDASTPQAWYWVHEFDKFRFINDWEIDQPTCPQNSQCLLIDDSSEHTNKDNPAPSDEWEIAATINGSLNQKVFNVYRNTN